MKNIQYKDLSNDIWLSWARKEILEGKLTDLIIPDYVEIIPERAFADCEYLVSVTFNPKVTDIRDKAFANCTSLKSIAVPGRFLGSFHKIFEGCNAVTSLTLTSGSAVAELACPDKSDQEMKQECESEMYAFPKLTMLEITDKVTEIDPETLSRFKFLKTIKVSKKHELYQSAGRDKILVEKKTGRLLYAVSANITGDILGIGPFAFKGLKSLDSIFIPKGIVKVDPQAFEGCKSLKSIVVSEDNPVFDSRNGCNAIIDTSTNTLVAACAGTILPEGVTTPALSYLKTWHPIVEDE